jgi:hypothetical protein
MTVAPVAPVTSGIAASLPLTLFVAVHAPAPVLLSVVIPVTFASHWLSESPDESTVTFCPFKAAAPPLYPLSVILFPAYWPLLAITVKTPPATLPPVAVP